MRRIKYFIYNIIRFIKWSPIIWHTREYDYTYGLLLLSFQLKLQLKYFTDQLYMKTVAIHDEVHIEALKRCIYHLDAMIDDDFVNKSDEELKFHEAEFFRLYKKYYRSWWD